MSSGLPWSTIDSFANHDWKTAGRKRRSSSLPGSPKCRINPKHSFGLGRPRAPSRTALIDGRIRGVEEAADQVVLGNGQVITTTIGRRRLVIVQFLVSLVGINAAPADGR
jgi:hypothetical protein